MPLIHKWAVSINTGGVGVPTSKRMSLDNTVSPTIQAGELSRRQSLDVNVERAVAMVNEDPDLDDDDDDCFRSPFGTRRDSLYK